MANRRIKSLPNSRTFLFVALFFFAFSIRFIYINKGPFHYDSLDLAQAAQKTFQTHTLHYEHPPGYPLTVLAASFSIFLLKFFGVTDPVFCANAMSVVAGALAVVLLFMVTEKLFDFHRAIISALLLATFAPHIVVSTYGKSFTLSICFALASIYCMLGYTQEKEAVSCTSPGYKDRHLILSAIFLGFCGAARMSDILMLLPVFCLFFSDRQNHHLRLRSFIFFIAVSFITAGLFYLPLFMEKGFAPFALAMSSKGMTTFLGPCSFALKYSFRWLLDLMTPGGTLLVFAGLAWMVLKRQARALLFLLAWFAVFQFFNGNISCANPRYLVIGWIPLVVAQGYLLGSFKGKGFYLILIVVFFFAMIGIGRYSPVLEFRHKRALQVEFAQWVAGRTPKGALVIALDESPFLQYYGRRETLERPLFDCNGKEIDGYFQGTLDKLLADGRDIYLVSSAFAYDPCRLFKKKIFQRYQVGFIASRLNEDWHNVFLDQELFREHLYQIKKK